MMETILRYLCLILEYDEDYNRELGSQAPVLRRAFQENIKKR